MPRYKRPLTIEEMRRVADKNIDRSDIPEASEAFWKNARVVCPPGNKEPLSLRLDADILAWFKAQGRGYRTRINAVLRAYVEAHRAGEKEAKPSRKRKADA
jgi:uncharacterized protein (DUF4415 family)